MASLGIAFGAAAAVTGTRVYAATAAAKGSRGGEEKGLLDWILGGLQKQDQLLETDPILKKVEEKSGTGGGGSSSGGSRKTSSVSVPPKKKNGDGGGFGGFFSKK